MKFVILYRKRITYLIIGVFLVIVVGHSSFSMLLETAITATQAVGVKVVNQATICGCGYAGCDCNQLTPRISPTPYWKFTPTWIDTPARPTWTFSFISPTPLAIWTFPATRLIPNTPTRILTSTIPPPKASWTFQPAPTFLRTSTSVAVTQPATIFIPTNTPLPSRTPTLTRTRVPTNTPVVRTATPLPTNTSIVPSGIITQDAVSILSSSSAASTQIPNAILTQVACQYSSTCLTQAAVTYTNLVATLGANATSFANAQATSQAVATFTPTYAVSSSEATLVANAQATSTAAALATHWAINPYACTSYYYVYCYSIYVNPSQTDNYYCYYLIGVAKSLGRGQNGECIIPIWINLTPAFYTPTPPPP